MAILTKNAILSAEDFEYAIVPCPEWGGDVRVRGLTAADQQYISRLNQSDKKEEMIYLWAYDFEAGAVICPYKTEGKTVTFI